jgi:hypothetical protein
VLEAMANLVGRENVSANKAGRVVAEVLRSYCDIAMTPPSKQVAGRAVLMAALVVDEGIARDMVQCQSLAVGVDSTTILSGRKFLALQFTGPLPDGLEFRSPGDIVELVQGGAKKVVEEIVKLWAYYTAVAQKLGLVLQPIYKLTVLCVDNTSENTGATNGVGVVLEKERLRAWEQDQAKPEGAQYQVLKLKGCSDHQAALVSKTFERKLIEIFKREGNMAMLYEKNREKRLNVVWLVKHLSFRLRTAPWKDAFIGWCLNTKKLAIVPRMPKVTSVRCDAFSSISSAASALLTTAWRCAFGSTALRVWALQPACCSTILRYL